MRVINSIATVCLSGTLEHKLEAIASAGFAGVEIFENDLLGYDGTARSVGQMIRDLGLICTCYQPFRDFEGLPAALHAKALDRAEAKFDVMQAVGADLLLVCSSVHPQAVGDTSRLVDDFRELGERAARRGLRIGYEALAWGHHVDDHRHAWEIVRQVDHPSVGLILDSFHSLARRIPIASIADIAASKIFLLQVADAPDMPMHYLYWSRHFRCFPAQGDLPVVDYLAAAIKCGFTGPLSLEIFNDRFREWSASQIAQDGLRALCVARDQAGISPSLPPRVHIQGIDFVEFAVHTDEAAALGTLLRAMGFILVGEHRSKNVSLWRQGQIHLVINRDSMGWAHAHWQNHGASICAIAVCVDSAQSALARAAALNIETFEQRAAAGELSIPWIRGVGGALTYFTEPDEGHGHWTHDFLATAPTAADREFRLGLTRVDHLSQVMRIEEFLSWQLYYLSLFDLFKSPPVEISDTRGLVQSQAIQSSGGEFRVTLEGASANQTLAARFLHGAMGAGVQCISFQTANIFDAASSAAANGLETLSVPPNYYDDIRARFGLSLDFVERLRQANILYDCDTTGEYLQLFSRAFEKRFFFEIVERRGYTGYGAANSAIRLAAQARYKPRPFD